MPQVHVDPVLVLEDGPPVKQCSTCGTKKKPVSKTFKQISARSAAKTPLFQKNDIEQMVAGVKTTLGVLMSHSCDIDRNGTLRFAAVRPLAFLDEYQQLRVRNRDEGNFSYMFLEPHGPMPPAVVDLDSQFFLSADIFGYRKKFTSAATSRQEHALVPYVEAIENRIASLNAASLEELYRRSTRHLVRPKQAEIVFTLSPTIFEDDANRPLREERQQRGWWFPRPSWLT